MKYAGKIPHGIRGGLRRAFGRRGAAAVEFAVISPLLFTLLFGIIEFGWRLMAKQTMVQASQVGARTAILPGATDADIQANVMQYLTAAGLADKFASPGGGSIVIVHGTVADPAETVTLSVPMSDVSLVGYFGATGTMTAASVMYK